MRRQSNRSGGSTRGQVGVRLARLIKAVEPWRIGSQHASQGLCEHIG
jgi:hypothetical protein